MIGLASDHAGFELKEFIRYFLSGKNIAFIDFGAPSTESCDYADYAHLLAKAIEDKRCESGIAICGSGNGINMTLNKYSFIRSALCWNPEIARLAKAHNNANVLVLPGRFITKEETEKCINQFLSTPFEGGKHQTRIEKMPVT